MRTGARPTAALVALWWTALALTVIAVRPATVADETRYLAVAWDMHRSGDLLLLRLNGHLYGHKPPLLFWLTELGWRAFGVQLWWPRMVTAAFGAGALLLVYRLGRRLAPADRDVAHLATLLTATSLLWVAFAGAVMFDLVLAFFVLLAVLHVLRAAEGAGWKAWVLVGVAIGLGILTKGPVALLHVLPLALLGPWWAASPPARASWYAGIGLAVLVAAAVALAWAIPAAVAGGEAFREEILWRQSAGRIASEGYHARPVWFHLAVLPVILMPWFLVPPWWRGLVAALRDRQATAVRFVIAWVVPVFVAFSLMKGKQIHYLLPEIAGFGLLAGAGMAMRGDASRAVAVVGSAWIAALVVVGALLGPRLLAPYDVSPFAREVAAAQRRGQPVAHFGVYHGEYAFPGRLERPLPVVQGVERALAWAAAHPDGAIVWRAERALALPGWRPLAEQRYRSGQVYLVPSADAPAFAGAWQRAANGPVD